MITLAQIELEMKDLQHEYDCMDTNERNKMKRRVSIIRKRMEFLEQCRLYMVNNPSEQWLIKEKARLHDRINKIATGFEAYCVGNNIKFELARDAQEKLYHKAMDFDTHKRHLKTVNYLLKQ